MKKRATLKTIQKRNWNILDVVILIMAILVIVMFLNRNQIFKKQEVTSSSNGKTTVYFEAEAFKLTQGSAGSFKIGDKITAQNKYQDGVIEKVELRNTVKTVVNPKGELIAFEDPLEKVLVIGIRAEANKLGPYIEIGGQALKVGGNYFIKTDNSEVYGKIKFIEVKE